MMGGTGKLLFLWCISFSHYEASHAFATRGGGMTILDVAAKKTHARHGRALRRAGKTRLNGSKWDNLVDEDDEDEKEAKKKVPRDMQYNVANIKRQVDNFDALQAVGGNDIVNDVYVRAPGEKTWWLVGKVARVSDVSVEQAVERQWPLIERHVWALRLPVRTSSCDPFEAWYAPGDSELDATRNSPDVQFVKVEAEKCIGADQVKPVMVGFVGKAYQEGEPAIFVMRTVDGRPAGPELEGKWVRE